MRYEVKSTRNGPLMELFHGFCEENGIVHDNDRIFAYLHTFEEKRGQAQMSLF